MADDDLYPDTMSDWQVRVMAFLYLVLVSAVIWWFAVSPICHVLNQAPKFTCYWEAFIAGPAMVLIGLAPLIAGRRGANFLSTKTSWVSTCVRATCIGLGCAWYLWFVLFVKAHGYSFSGMHLITALAE